MIEFDCAECGRHIVRFMDDGPSRLCAECTTLPGWFKDPRLREMLDPGYDLSEAPASINC
jgi:hypothetical protein